MSKQKIAITGASGFIGNFLAKYFSDLGYLVIGFVRSTPSTPTNGVLYKNYYLDENPVESDFIGIDLLIHCAYVKSTDDKNSEAINISGTKFIIDISRKCGIKKIIFLSSLSALENAKSSYGKSKYKLESLFDFNQDLVLKPGLVIGKGGLFNSIFEIIYRSKFIPMIDGGKQKLQYIYIEDLAICIKLAFENNFSGSFPISNQSPILMRTFYKEITETIHKKCYFIYLPYFLANILFTIIDYLNLPFSISKENLLGLKNIQYIDVSKSLEIFRINPISFRESIKKVTQ